MAAPLLAAGIPVRALALPVAGAAGVAVLAKVASARRFLVRLAILGIRSVTATAFVLVIRNIIALSRAKKSFSLRRMMWYAMSAWATAEVLFLAYLLEYKRRLESQTTRRWQAITTHSTEEKRMKSMERYLLCLSQVRGGGEVQSARKSGGGTESTSLGLRRTSPSPEPPGGNNNVKKSLSVVDGSAWGLNKLRSFPSHNSLFGMAQSNRQESVDDLLKLWEGHETVDDSELQKLRWVELASFFTGPGRGEAESVAQWLYRGNVEEWVAHYWFRGAHPEDLRARPREYQELGRLVDTVLDSAGLMHLRHGRNPQVKCFRTFTDPLPVLHRPLIVYAGTSLLCPLLTLQVMSRMGFHRERVGGLAYWKRDPRRVPADLDTTGQTPLVFVHGLGVGLVPYYLFIYRLSQRHSGDLYVPEFPFLAMAPWESVPSAREVVAQLQDMLAANGHTAAHFAGHSFGAVVIGWVMKMSASSVIMTTLMEPAHFLMMKSECLAKVLYGEPQTCFEILIRYFGFRELFTANLLCRNFFWEQSTMWPEDIFVPAVIELAGGDHIVQSLFVRRLLEHERAARKERRKVRKPRLPGSLTGSGSSVDVRSNDGPRREASEVMDILWCDGFLHGEILWRPRAQERLFAKMRQMRQHVEQAR